MKVYLYRLFFFGRWGKMDNTHYLEGWNTSLNILIRNAGRVKIYSIASSGRLNKFQRSLSKIDISSCSEFGTSTQGCDSCNLNCNCICSLPSSVVKLFAVYCY